MKTNYLDHIVTDATLAAIADCIDTEGDGEFDYTELVGLLETGAGQIRKASVRPAWAANSVS